MPVDFHYGVKADVQLFSRLRRVHEHIKTAVKNGVVQIHGPETSPICSVLSSVGPSGVLGLCIKNALCPLTRPHEACGDVNFSFRNTSIGNGFTHTREIFGSNIVETNIVFYRRGEDSEASPAPQFVRTTISYGDNVTTTVHKSLVDPKSLPAFHDRMDPDGKPNRLFLSGKTMTMLVRWLRQQKTKTDQAVTVAVSETLSVVTFSVAGVSKILDFSPEPGTSADWDALKRKKEKDVGAVRVDTAIQVSLESLLLALRLCKIPGWFTPGLLWHSNDILEVYGVPVGTQTCDAKLSVLLLKVDGPLESEDTESHRDQSGIHHRSNSNFGREDGSRTPPSQPVTPCGDFDLGESPEGRKSTPVCPYPLGKESRRPPKRRSISGGGRDRIKVHKTSFNPLI
ncbi:DNA polymerase processivity subunit [Colobine gammaherpesvirus 1]|uniref:DNA polymerase processivity subunit n=1 Tax=Colobine gammaherpesvirus 1 TaxID=2597325 RepID=A0A5B8G5F8_9GAMA|nr:DNA polymerase processivity subunit [Colobine gammaherpesvirus 1]QDQ69270.1 DNA polymerase processivity subunit [Colobine gammaherpesvirus 1]